MSVVSRSSGKECLLLTIAKEITANELYFKKDGSFVDGKQVRSCANNNSDIFVCLPNNIIKLKTDIRTVIVKEKK